MAQNENRASAGAARAVRHPVVPARTVPAPRLARPGRPGTPKTPKGEIRFWPFWPILADFGVARGPCLEAENGSERKSGVSGRRARRQTPRSARTDCSRTPVGSPGAAGRAEHA